MFAVALRATYARHPAQTRAGNDRARNLSWKLGARARNLKEFPSWKLEGASRKLEGASQKLPGNHEPETSHSASQKLGRPRARNFVPRARNFEPETSRREPKTNVNFSAGNLENLIVKLRACLPLAAWKTPETGKPDLPDFPENLPENLDNEVFSRTKKQPTNRKPQA